MSIVQKARVFLNRGRLFGDKGGWLFHLQSYEKRFTYPNECAFNLDYSAKSYKMAFVLL